MHHHVAGISTVDLFRVAWRRRGILLAAFLLGIGASAGTILWMPRTYVARAVLMIEPRLEPSPDGSGTVVPILPDSATVDSLAQLLASRSLAQDVVGRLTDRILLIRPGRAEAVVQELQKMGHTPQVAGKG